MRIYLCNVIYTSLCLTCCGWSCLHIEGRWLISQSRFFPIPLWTSSQVVLSVKWLFFHASLLDHIAFVLFLCWLLFTQNLTYGEVSRNTLCSNVDFNISWCNLCDLYLCSSKMICSDSKVVVLLFVVTVGCFYSIIDDVAMVDCNTRVKPRRTLCTLEHCRK